MASGDRIVRDHLLRWIPGVLTVAGLAWMAWALRGGWQDLSLSALPNPPSALPPGP